MLKTYPGMHPSRGGLETIVQENREFMVNPMYSLVEAQAFRSIIDRLRTEILALMDQGKTAKQLLQTLQNLALICKYPFPIMLFLTNCLRCLKRM